MARPQLTASEALSAWLEHLAHERRLSPRTLEAYGHIGRLYLAFLDRHRGEALSLTDLGTITAAEVLTAMFGDNYAFTDRTKDDDGLPAQCAQAHGVPVGVGEGELGGPVSGTQATALGHDGGVLARRRR